ncbi:hypothetical protein LEA_14272, partial [human gut metagenome]
LNENVTDNLIVNPYAGWSIEGRFAFDVKAGALFAPQRGRSVDHEWRKPYGGQLDLTVSRWGVKIENNLYVGKNLQPLRGEIANPATGITYGADGLYAGEAFYATTEHIYNRTWVSYDRRFSKIRCTSRPAWSSTTTARGSAHSRWSSSRSISRNCSTWVPNREINPYTYIIWQAKPTKAGRSR